MASFDAGMALDRRKRHVSPEYHRGEGQTQCKPSTRLSPGSLKSYSIVVVGAASNFSVVQGALRMLSWDMDEANSPLIPRKEQQAAKSRELDNADHDQYRDKEHTHSESSALRIVSTRELLCCVCKEDDERTTMTSAGKPRVVVRIASRLSRLTWSCETQVRSEV